MNTPLKSPFPLRVIHVASGREWRGGQKQAWLLARELHRLGVTQVVVTGKGTELASALEADGVPVHPVDWKAGLSPAAAKGAWEEADRMGLLHAHDGHATTLAGMVATMRRRPFITTRRVVFPLRRQGFWKRADRVVAISGAVRRVLIADGIPEKRVPVIHSGVDLESLATVRGDGAREAAGLPLDRPIAIAVGQLEASKDQQTLLRAAVAARTRCPELLWVIVGRGPLQHALEAEIRALGLGDTVRLIGFLPDPLPLVATAQVFVTSSKEEGLGTAMLDAMALGLPVAATAGGGIPEILAGGAGRVVEIGNAMALGEAVVQILSEDIFREALITQSKSRVADFSAKRMAEEYLTLYRSLLQTPDGS